MLIQHFGLLVFVVLGLLISPSECDCTFIKPCVQSPRSESDNIGIKACFADRNATDCLTTSTAPFYVCRCTCDRCSRPPTVDCEMACGVSPANTTRAPPQTSTTAPVQRPRLFAIGGVNSAVTMRVDVYDFKTAKWTRIADLLTPTGYLGAAAFGGRVYAIGGYTSGGGASASTSVYNPKTSDAWAIAPSMTARRHGLGVAVLGPRIYAIGGDEVSAPLRTGESFDPAINKTWVPIANMSTPRFQAAVTVLDDRLYAIGGSGGAEALKSVEMYDPQANRWSKVAPINIARQHHCAASVDGKVYAIGGYFLKSVEVYDPKTTVWSFVADMSTVRMDAGAFSLNELLYVVGGYNGLEVLDTIEMFNPKINAWSVFPSRMPVQRYAHGVALLLDDAEM